MPVILDSDPQDLLKPGLLYECKLVIKDKDYTQDLESVRIISSIVSSYPIVFLEIFLDPADVILDEIYGEESFNLTITLLTEKVMVVEDINLELMYTSANNMLTMKKISRDKDQVPDRVLLSFPTVCKSAFKTITSLVNEVYMQQSVKEVIEDLVNSVGATVDYQTDDENDEKIDQIIIPPTTLYKAINYLDNTFGLYNGIGIAYCQYDNTLFVKNLSKKIKQESAFTVHLLTSDEDNEEIIQSSLDGETFYTYYPLRHKYTGNTVFSVLAKHLNHIVKPRDTLYHIVEQDLTDVCSSYGLIDRNMDIPIDSALESRIRYYNSHTGYDESEYFANSSISKRISGLSSINLTLERNLKFFSLIDVGESIQIDSNILEYVDYTGKYILRSSDIIIARIYKEWEAACTINIMRTNVI